jgi:hypothetical protein
MKLLHFVITCLFLSMSIHADTIEDRRKVAVEIIEVHKGSEVDIEMFRKSCVDKIVAEAQKKVSPEDLKNIRKATTETMSTISRAQLVEAMAEGYAARLTLDELKGILSFYNSSAGKALRREQIQINQEMLAQLKNLTGGKGKEAAARYEALKKETKE